MPTFEIESSLPFDFIAGTDEAGRGPLCGPVVAAAVMFPKDHADIDFVISKLKINDSKKMTAMQRDAAYDWLTANSEIIWAAAQCSPKEIDEINILHASMKAMQRAVSALARAPQFVLVDGNRAPDFACPARAIVQGDAKSISVAAASIIAKVTRDRIMRKLAVQFPEYGWEKNAGYPTASHLQAIDKYGINEHYRKTFAPVARIAKIEKE
ncbi:MAG: ribonuclease HII [Rickettsiales bacterium]|jgi:ribonuclease HII|nr:ribonuclease HII [Rickettsiales bacterium]